jgi:sec-independent protein translocase protein TatB
MPSIGPLEILVVAVVALIVFGPERLPDIARTVGRTASNLRRMASEVREEFEFGLDDDDLEPPASSPPRRRGAEAGRDGAAPDPEEGAPGADDRRPDEAPRIEPG